jgi:hypothetical protein
MEEKQLHTRISAALTTAFQYSLSSELRGEPRAIHLCANMTPHVVEVINLSETF